MALQKAQLHRCVSAANCSSFLQSFTASLIPRRFRYKKKWAVNRKPTGPCQLALDNFDAFYKPVYGERWPLIRLSLLSLPKYCAVINKYADPDVAFKMLSSIGAEDFIIKAQKIQNELEQSERPQSEENINNINDPIQINSTLPGRTSEGRFDSAKKFDAENKEQPNPLDPEVESMYDDLYKDNVDVFVPTTKVLSVRDQLMREEISMSTFEPRDIEVAIHKPEVLPISRDIRAMMFAPGDMSRFPPARSFNRRLGYYLMDAASVLPVLALNVQPSDIVLDLCAAPGGKSALILQSLDPSEGGHLHCNELASGRFQRLKEVLSSYFPSDIVEEVNVTQMDGVAPHQPVYNKVLVDVPCNADRHVVNEEDNNLFRPIRTKERLSLMRLQTKLLISAIKSCKVGGEIVYATCTLAPAQNDGVIQAAVEELVETTQIEVAVQDMSDFVSLFKNTFQFYDRSRYGQTVLPDLLNNYGPSYFAKLKRLK